jgi:hypothetical protein
VFAAGIQPCSLGAGPAQRLLGVGEQSFGVLGRRLGKLRQLTGHPVDRGSCGVFARGRAQLQLGSQVVRALAS